MLTKHVKAYSSSCSVV